MNKKVIQKNLIKVLVWIPVIITGILITGFSTQNGSQSSGMSRKAAIVVIDFTDEIRHIEHSASEREILIEKMQYPIRKAAHMTEYAIFTIFVFVALSIDGLKNKKRLLLSFFIAFLLACSDEYHQTFVPERCGTYKDVIIDSVGVIIALIFCTLLCTMSIKRKKSQKGEI